MNTTGSSQWNGTGTAGTGVGTGTAGTGVGTGTAGTGVGTGTAGTGAETGTLATGAGTGTLTTGAGASGAVAETSARVSADPSAAAAGSMHWLVRWPPSTCSRHSAPRQTGSRTWGYLAVSPSSSAQTQDRSVPRSLLACR